MLSLIICLLAPVNAQTSPARSHSKLVSANGQGVLVFDDATGTGSVIADFYDRVYQQENAASDPVRDLLYDTYFGIDGVWLTEQHGSGYHFPGSGVMSITRTDNELPIEAVPIKVTEWAWAPMGLDHPGYVHMLELENRTPEPKTMTVNSLHNVHVGHDVGGILNGGELIWSDGQNIVESGETTGLGMWFQTTRDTTSFTCDGAFADVGGFNGDCGTESEPWPNNDQVGGFEWTVTVPGESSAWVDVSAMFFSGDDTSTLEDLRVGWIDEVLPEYWVTREGAYWNTFHSTVSRPPSISETEFAVFKQNLVFLKMAQVTESGPGFGQIPASLPVGAEHGEIAHIWNITWVRDQAYAAVALARAGKLEEARAALAFTLQGKAGDYVDEVGSEYGLSVCRLYGDGSEWSDDDGTGPNIELDNFGLTLWAIDEYVQAGGDPSFWTEYNVFADVAEPLLNAIDEVDLIQPDSSIWERHWNGNEKHFTYTSAMAARGLYAAHSAVGDAGAADDYLDAWLQLREGICSNLVDPDLGLLGNAEEPASEAIDLAAVEAINHGLVDAQGPVTDASLATWEAQLAVANGMGFKRNDDGGLYDEQEWVVMDLRLAEAYRRNCQVDKAKDIEAWITQQAWLNNFNIPELLDPDSGEYAGPSPMLGFGSGAYILGLYSRQDAALDCAGGLSETCDDLLGIETTDDTGDAGSGGGGSGSADEDEDTGGTDEDSKGCGCSASSGAGSWLVIPLMFVVLIRRRPIFASPIP